MAEEKAKGMNAADVLEGFTVEQTLAATKAIYGDHAKAERAVGSDFLERQNLILRSARTP